MNVNVINEIIFNDSFNFNTTKLLKDIAMLTFDSKYKVKYYLFSN